MKVSFLQYLQCPHCRSVDLKVHSFRNSGEEIENGMIVCNACRVWYPVVDGIPVVSKTPVLVDKWKKAVRAQWGQNYDFSSLKEPLATAEDAKASEDQGAQIEFYDHEADRYDEEITDTTFWRAFAKQTIHAWGATTEAKAGVILEVGCGTGASTAALAGLGCRIVALDICLTTAKRAREKIRRLGLDPAVDFIVSEAEDLPFRPGLFKSSVFSGVLHHVSDPIRVLKQISGVLCEGGTIYGHENNASAFRFLFDLLMKMKQLWHEEAGTHPLMKAAQVQAWGKQAGLRVKAKSLVFLPPHFFNLFPRSLAEGLLSFSNFMFGWVPWFKDQGGLLILSGTKMTRE
ncbi:MAG: methyltransferase domain-containing protein [Candidatus Omnitrophota bacterium]